MKFMEYLEREKLTYDEVSAHIGCSKNTIYRIAHGMHYPKPTLANLISEYTDFEVTLDDLYMDRPKKPICPTCGHKLGKKRSKDLKIGKKCGKK